MSNELGRYCLITGCAGGIGQSLVRGFSSAGYQVIGTDIFHFLVINSYYKLLNII